jgi:hypothetical protein
MPESRTLMKPMSRFLVLLVSAVSLSTAFGQITLVYDNGISSVDNGRVNDTNFPANQMYADNFSLAAARQVNQIDWLGAYKNGDLLPDANDGFTIRFFAFNGATPATSPFATYQIGAVQREMTSQTLPFGNPVFSYSAQIPLTSFPAGTYLLSIMNGHAGAPWTQFSGGGVAEFAFSLSLVPEPSVGAFALVGGLIFAGRRHLPGSVRTSPN